MHVSFRLMRDGVLSEEVITFDTDPGVSWHEVATAINAECNGFVDDGYDVRRIEEVNDAYLDVPLRHNIIRRLDDGGGYVAASV